MDILIALVERAGELVGKTELATKVWPDKFVVEGNLKVNVAALRRAPGDGQGRQRYIVTTTGQGYRFVAPITGSVGISDDKSDHHQNASERRASPEGGTTNASEGSDCGPVAMRQLRQQPMRRGLLGLLPLDAETSRRCIVGLYASFARRPVDV